MTRRRSSRSRPPVHLDPGDVDRLPPDEIAVMLRGAEDLIGSGGRTMLTRILKGSKAKPLLEHGLDMNPSYGALKDFTLEEIQHRVDWLITNHYLEIERRGDFPVLVYSGKGLAIERKTVSRDWYAQCQEMMESEGPFLMAFLKDKVRPTVWLLLDAIADSKDAGFVPLLEAWKAIDVKKVRQRIDEVIRELRGIGPKHRFHFECCLVDECLSFERVRALFMLGAKFPFAYDRMKLVVEEIAGAQDIEIIQEHLDRQTCLLTSDGAFHNAALRKGKFSFYLNDENAISRAPVPNARTWPGPEGCRC